jgi:uncharacterized BrkB/YihY/UPF0761 family membrane protein
VTDDAGVPGDAAAAEDGGVPDDAGRPDDPASPDPAGPPTTTTRGRIAAGRERVEHEISSTYQRLEAARPQSGPIDTAFRAFERDNATGGGVLSAAIAFRAFLILVPYVFFCVVAFGLASEVSSDSPEELARAAGITGLMARTLTSAGNLESWDRVWAICISGFAVYLAARAVVKVLRITHGLIWRVRVPKLTNSTAAAGAVVGLLTVQLAVGGFVSWLRSQSTLLAVFGLVLAAALPFGVWLLASIKLPHAECPWWALVPGAALVAAGLTGLQAATVFYFTGSIERKSDTYGAIGTSLALLLWAYVLGRIITASISLNAAFWYRGQERQGLSVPAPMDLEEELSKRPPGP